jgi:UPF0755 protein
MNDDANEYKKSSSGKETPSTSEEDNESISMYPSRPDGEGEHFDYAAFESPEKDIPVSFLDPYAAEYSPTSDEELPLQSETFYPSDLPPWYEDEYYDDREWERLPRRFNAPIRFAIFSAVLIVAILLTYNFVRGWLDDQLDPPGLPGSELVIEIPQGATTDDIARILAENEIVENSTVFRYYLRFKDASDFRAGVYTFRINSAVWDARESLEAGPLEIIEERFYVTIPEGLTLQEMQTSLLTQLPSFDIDELANAISYSQTPVSLGDDWVGYIREGIFFPETYDVAENAMKDEQSLLNRMVVQFDLVASETGLANPPPELNLSPYEVLIVASLIEEEAKVDEDRAKISRVIYNRLELGIPLGIDATIVYALGGDRELSQSDLEVASVYNTRIHVGLPPSPISAPGKSSIEAALNPEIGDWLYYVRTDAFGFGSHTFATTNQEFQEAVQVCVERDLGCG